MRASALAELAAYPELRTSERAATKLRESLTHNADRPGALLELARLEWGAAAEKRSAKAEALFRRALALDATFAASYLNYADYLRAQKREAELYRTLAAARAARP